MIRLIQCNEPILRAILEGDEALAQVLQVNVPPSWSIFGAPAFAYSLDKILDHPEDAKWLTYLPILTASNTLVGSGGFKGRPSEAGEVEIGYEVAQAFQNLGIATAVTQELVRIALADEMVKLVCAHTLAEANASGRVLRKCGFVKVAELTDEEDGDIWRWELKRSLDSN